jgi:ribosomal protein L11 methylase PrmA
MGLFSSSTDKASYLSGFYEHDQSDLLHEARTHGLSQVKHDVREQWACLQLVKSVK